MWNFHPAQFASIQPFLNSDFRLGLEIPKVRYESVSILFEPRSLVIP